MNVNLKILNTAYCFSIEKLALKTAPWRHCQFPALFAVIEHPDEGIILFDTGHSHKFFELTQKFPMKIYRWVTKVALEEEWEPRYQLAQLGINANDVKYIIISHFHADHIGALNDFPKAKFIYLQSAYDAVKNLNVFAALKAGFLPGLLPFDFLQRSRLLDHRPKVQLPADCYPFQQGYPLFNDSSLIAVELPGHANGQIGLFAETKQQRLLLAADACWSSQAYQSLVPPHKIAFVIMPSQSQYMHTLNCLHQLHQHSPHIKIIPSHCNTVWNELRT